jgi:hypothetical protein
MGISNFRWGLRIAMYVQEQKEGSAICKIEIRRTTTCFAKSVRRRWVNKWTWPTLRSKTWGHRPGAKRSNTEGQVGLNANPAE